MRSVIATLLVLCSFSLLLVPPTHSQQSITLNTANAPPNATEDFSGIGDRVLTEAFRRLGMKLKIVRLPSERALQNANEGIDDGNFARVSGLTALYPNLIQVPEPITRFEFVAVLKILNFRAEGWHSLRPYNVGIITGWKILEKNITGTKSLTKVKNRHQLFNMMMAERVDLIVYDRYQALVLLEELHIAEKVKILEPPMAIRDMYPYLHKKHKNLAPRLADAIRRMKSDGTYDRIVDDVMKPFKK